MPATPPHPNPPKPTPKPPLTTPPHAPEEKNNDGPYNLFTAAYHLKRGYCCNSGCRHCPYREEE